MAGLSAGSGATLSTLWAHPGKFAYIGAMSAFGNVPGNANVAAINDGIPGLTANRTDITSVEVRTSGGRPVLKLVA